MIFVCLSILIASGCYLSWRKSSQAKREYATKAEAALKAQKKAEREEELALMREAASNIESLQAILDKTKLQNQILATENVNLKAALEQAYQIHKEIIHNKRVACLFGQGNILGGTQAGMEIGIQIFKRVK